MNQNRSLLKFYRVVVSKEEFSNLKAHALKCSSVLGSMYLCQQFFSKMNITKSRYKSRLTDKNLGMQLRVATLSVRQNIERLVKKKVSKNLTKGCIGIYSLIFHKMFLCYFLPFHASLLR